MYIKSIQKYLSALQQFDLKFVGSFIRVFSRYNFIISASVLLTRRMPFSDFPIVWHVVLTVKYFPGIRYAEDSERESSDLECECCSREDREKRNRHRQR